MSDFVNFKKRGIQLPEGCKDLADVFKLQKAEAETGSTGLMGDNKCVNCGGPAVSGSGMWSDGKLSEESWCEQCLKDLCESAHEPGNSLPDDADFDDEAVKRLDEAINRREAEFMRHRVAERKAPR
jgi:hypothetical protein